jgi:hypothetical protein|eukprot:311316-Prymnesium_polylepis.2
MVVEEAETREAMQRTVANAYNTPSPAHTLMKSPPSVLRAVKKEGPRVLWRETPGLVRFRMNVPSEQKAINELHASIDRSEYTFALESAAGGLVVYPR